MTRNFRTGFALGLLRGAHGSFLGLLAAALCIVGLSHRRPGRACPRCGR